MGRQFPPARMYVKSTGRRCVLLHRAVMHHRTSRAPVLVDWHGPNFHRYTLCMCIAAPSQFSRPPEIVCEDYNAVICVHGLHVRKQRKQMNMLQF